MSTPSQISIFPATSATATYLTELLQRHHPDIRIRLAARSPNKLSPSSDNVVISQTPLDVANPASIEAALQGSDAAYFMNPPFIGESDPFAMSQTYSNSFVKAANASTTLNKIVYLSSIGAEMTSGSGPIRNVHIGESGLLANLRDGIDTIAIRPPSFLSNLGSVLPLALKPPHILPSMLIPFEKAYMSIDTSAIATKVLEHLVAPHISSPNADRKGHLTAVQLITQPKTIPEIAQMVSDVVGVKVNPVPIPQSEWFSTFKRAGFPDQTANLFLEMTTSTVAGKLAFLDPESIAKESSRGITILSEQTHVDHKLALKKLVDQVKSA